MTRKYVLLPNEAVTVCGVTLRRIQRVSDGARGGYVETEENLSQEGACWLHEHARAWDRARVTEDAQVHGEVFGQAVVSGRAIVQGQVCGRAQVTDDALVQGKVHGDAVVRGRARVLGEACGHAVVEGRTVVKGRVYGDAGRPDHAVPSSQPSRATLVVGVPTKVDA